MPEVHLDKSPKKNIPLTRIQKLIGRRMLHSKLNKPCFYLESKADITHLMELRPKLRKSLGVKITTNAFYIHALASAAAQYPLMVGKLDGNQIKIADSINVGFAVSAPHGLIVPVIREAHQKTLIEIARLEKTLTEQARDNKLKLEDMEGETIALSNLGVYGIDSFIGIVPPPAGTILAIGNITRTLIPRQGQVSVRKLLSLTLAVDHRIINGDYAAQFLNQITEQLQNPERMLSEKKQDVCV